MSAPASETVVLTYTLTQITDAAGTVAVVRTNDPVTITRRPGEEISLAFVIEDTWVNTKAGRDGMTQSLKQLDDDLRKFGSSLDEATVTSETNKEQRMILVRAVGRVPFPKTE